MFNILNYKDMARKINMEKHVWEGWSVRDFVTALSPQIDVIMSGGSWLRPFTDKEQLKKWCTENQPYYKKAIPDVINYFAEKYGIK